MNLTDRQEYILDVIKKYINEYGYPPMIRELCHLCGVSSTATISAHLKKIETKGYIHIDNFRRRGIKVINE